MLACASDFEGWYCVVDGKSYVRCVGVKDSSCVVESIGLGIQFEITDVTRVARLVSMSEMSEFEFLRTYCCDGMIGDRCILFLIGYEKFEEYLDVTSDVRGTLSFYQEDRLHYIYREWFDLLDCGNDEMTRAIDSLLTVCDRFGVVVCDAIDEDDDGIIMSGVSFIR